MKRAIRLLSLLLCLGSGGAAQAYDGHVARDIGVGCAAGAVTLGAVGGFLGAKAGNPRWPGEVKEGAVIGCGIGGALGGVGGAVAAEAPGEDELRGDEAPAADQERLRPETGSGFN